ncbi:hypothetical protein Plec18170_005696 [Paecilomyces lecythidis]
MLDVLMTIIYFNIRDPNGPKFQFPSILPTPRYMIAGERYAASPEGMVAVMVNSEKVPIISYAAWFEGETWKEFLEDTLSVMLGQLAKNVKFRNGHTGFQDQEVFVLGFHGLGFHIVRGFFTADVISRVQVNGCSVDDAFELRFTRSYNLLFKQDWLEATRALTRLLRYLQSGESKVGAMQAYLLERSDVANSSCKTMEPKLDSS